jgi:ParB-like chromosome segregation protein Spo0J
MCIDRGVNIELVPCLQEAKGTGERERIANQFTGNASKKLNPREAAFNIKRLMRYGNSIEEVAKDIGMSRSYVAQMLDFEEKAPEEAHAAIARGEISATLAAEIVRQDGPAKAAETIKQAVAKAKASGKPKATGRHVERAPKATAPIPAPTPAPEPPTPSLLPPAMVLEQMIAKLIKVAQAGDVMVASILEDAGIKVPEMA